MSILHLCNTFFEWELCGQAPNTLELALSQNSIFLQLQFLPLIYAGKDDGILVTEKPQMEGNFYLLSEHPPFKKLETWGHSKLAKAWADKQGIGYEIPDWDLVKKVNSKAYSFEKSPLPGAKLLHPGDSIPSPGVLKSCFGAAGSGHVFTDSPRVLNFCKVQWELGLPVLFEPWMNRQLDFSTQWKITREGEILFLGTTFCKTTSSGAHQSNRVNDLKSEELYAPFIIAQKTKAQEVLKEMQEWDYFGEVGFDAMIYDEKNLQPIVEINARKTMGWAALEAVHKPDVSHFSGSFEPIFDSILGGNIDKRYYPRELNRKSAKIIPKRDDTWLVDSLLMIPSHQTVEMAFIPSDNEKPLPKELKRVKFSRQLIISIQ